MNINYTFNSNHTYLGEEAAPMNPSATGLVSFTSKITDFFYKKTDVPEKSVPSESIEKTLREGNYKAMKRLNSRAIELSGVARTYAAFLSIHYHRLETCLVMLRSGPISKGDRGRFLKSSVEKHANEIVTELLTGDCSLEDLNIALARAQQLGFQDLVEILLRRLSHQKISKSDIFLESTWDLPLMSDMLLYELPQYRAPLTPIPEESEEPSGDGSEIN